MNSKLVTMIIFFLLFDYSIWERELYWLIIKWIVYIAKFGIAPIHIGVDQFNTAPGRFEPVADADHHERLWIRREKRALFQYGHHFQVTRPKHYVLPPGPKHAQELHEM